MQIRKVLDILYYLNNFVPHFAKHISHYWHNIVLKLSIFACHNELLRATNVSDEQRVYE